MLLIKSRGKIYIYIYLKMEHKKFSIIDYYFNIGDILLNVNNRIYFRYNRCNKVPAAKYFLL